MYDYCWYYHIIMMMIIMNITIMMNIIITIVMMIIVITIEIPRGEDSKKEFPSSPLFRGGSNW